jgi:hypothetical protein
MYTIEYWRTEKFVNCNLRHKKIVEIQTDKRTDRQTLPGYWPSSESQLWVPRLKRPWIAKAKKAKPKTFKNAASNYPHIKPIKLLFADGWKKIKNVVSGQIVGFVRSKEKKLICKKNCWMTNCLLKDEGQLLFNLLRL